jgi:ATP-dependent helicase/nuclease subunit B
MRQAARDFVRLHAADGVLILATQRDAADEIALEVCDTVLAGADRYGFRDFVHRASREELRRRGLVPVGRVVREAIAARIAGAVELTYFREAAAFPGFPRALTDTLEEVRLNRRAVDGDLAKLLAAYERELRERHFADHAARVAVARDALRHEHSRFRRAAVVLLDLAVRTAAEQELLAELKQSARAHLELHLDDTPASGATSLEQLQAKLFAGVDVEPRPEDASVEIFSTSGEALECVEIARRIAHSGVPFDEIGILLRSPERYQPLVLEGLRRAGIPAYCTRGVARPDPAGRAFLALLACAEEGLSASRFAEYLSLGQMPEGDEWISPAGRERILVDASVIGGRDRWERRLAGLRAEAVERHAKAEDDDERDRLARRIEQTEALERFALPVISRLAELPKSCTWGEWIERLSELAEATLKAPERILELAAELEPMSALGPVSIEQVLLVLGPRLNALRVPERDARFGRVWVGGIEEARGMSFRRVFVPGVNEGLFPRPPAEDPLLPGEPRGDDRELLRIAAACASERFSISFSRLDLLTGRERVPSFFAFEAWHASGAPELEVREFEARARVATATRIGWPAPRDPNDAIDDAEFDLATLEPRREGSGLYLKKLPGRAVDSLRARWMRWDPKRWRPADGLVVEEIGSDLMKLYSIKQRAWSPSLLEQYARCPYRFALRGIHGLSEAARPEALQRMDPATRGMIYHEVQAELLQGTDWLERLDEVLDRIAAEYEEKLAPAIPQIWRTEVQTLRADLRGWVQQKLALEPDWTPVACEQKFDVTLEGGYWLNGRIDLIERHASKILRVVDHKTGKPRDPRPETMGCGEVLQPALYALAAEAMLNESVSFGRLWYATIARNYDSIEVPLNEWTRRRAVAVLARIDGAILDGFLPAAPRKDGCKGCEFVPVCGPYEEERSRSKSQADLSGLRELRSWK